MTFENLLLRCLFIATLLVCGLTFIAMTKPAPKAEQLAANTPATVLATIAPSGCPLPADGVLCPLRRAG